LPRHEQVAAVQKRLKAQEDMAKGAAAARRPPSLSVGLTRQPSGGAGFGSGASTARLPLPSPRESAGAPGSLSARKAGAGMTGTTASLQAKLEGRKEAECEKAALAIAAKPKDWLKNELAAVVEQQKLRDQVTLQLELRRQAALKLQALEVRNESAAGAMDAELSGAGADTEEACEEARAARQAETESLKAKVAQYSQQVQALQLKLVRQESAETVSAKIDAVHDVKHAKALLKAAFPQLVQLQLGLTKKEQVLENKSKQVSDATELANTLRLQMIRERKAAEAQAKEIAQLQQVVKASQATEASAPLALPPPPPPAAPPPENKGFADLDARLAAIRHNVAKHDVPLVKEDEDASESEESSESESEEELDESDISDWEDTEEARMTTSKAERARLAKISADAKAAQSAEGAIPTVQVSLRPRRSSVMNTPLGLEAKGKVSAPSDLITLEEGDEPAATPAEAPVSSTRDKGASEAPDSKKPVPKRAPASAKPAAEKDSTAKPAKKAAGAAGGASAPRPALGKLDGNAVRAENGGLGNNEPRKRKLFNASNGSGAGLEMQPMELQ
jgi:hypothetical protein